MIIFSQISFTSPINISCQVGDMVYYTSTFGAGGGFSTSDTSNLIQLGPVTEVNMNGTQGNSWVPSITVMWDDSIINITTNPLVGAYFVFAKNKMINTTSLLGYYAEAKFVNNSDKDIELFSVGSELVESSK